MTNPRILTFIEITTPYFSSNSSNKAIEVLRYPYDERYLRDITDKVIEVIMAEVITTRDFIGFYKDGILDGALRQAGRCAINVDIVFFNYLKEINFDDFINACHHYFDKLKDCETLDGLLGCKPDDGILTQIAVWDVLEAR